MEPGPDPNGVNPVAVAAVEEGLGTTGDDIVDEAIRRWRRCSEWESQCRERFIEDLKFRHGDSDNGYQWPNAVRRSRDVDAKPCLTINLIRQHNLMVTNAMRKNKRDVRIVGTGNGATAESARMLDQVVKQIQWSSDAQNAYTLARAFQVDGGIGYWRLGTRYVEDEFYQEIYIEQVNDPLTVYLDPDIQTVDGRDAKFAFVFDLVPKAEFIETYPRYAELAGLQPLGTLSADDDFMTKDHVRVCEYFRVVNKSDVLYGFVDPVSGERKTIRKSRLTDQMIAKLDSLPTTMTRPIETPEVEWYLIVGETRADHTVWPGKFIPIIRCVGEEIVIEGILDRKGHTRAMKDAQRMLNYNSSGQVEHVALQTKTPWIGAAAAIEEHEGMWNTANTQNYSYLPFNHLDDDGNPLPPQALPQRQNPPMASPAFEAGMTTAFNQIMMVSGQWQNQMGMLGNERTGAAIEQRQDQGETATYHFQDNFDSALVFTGVQIVDLIPRIYDSKRILRIQADGQEDFELLVDPGARQAFQARKANDGEVVERIFNPQVGRYDVRPLPGNSGTKRQDTAEAMKLILTQAPGLTGIIGDLLLKSLDFDEAQEAAERLRRMVPPQALGEGPSQQEQALMAQIAQLKVALGEAIQKLGKEQLKVTGKDQMRDIDAYKAETDRFKALADVLMLDQGGLQQVIDQLVKEAAQTHLTPILQANAEDINSAAEESQEAGASSSSSASGEPSGSALSAVAAPLPGAQRAPDGEWYLADPTRRGKYLRVAPLAQERGARNILANV